MTKVEKLTREVERSYDIKVTTDKSLTGAFYIPVVDVRDGEAARERADAILKEHKRNTPSKYLRPSFGSGGGSYQVSHKKPIE